MAQPYPSFTPTYHHNPYPKIDPSNPSLSSTGLKILITGGGQGIGQAIALAFAKAQASQIALLGRNLSTLEETAAKIHEVSAGVTRAFAVQADVTDLGQVREAFGMVVEGFGGKCPDVLVNNAGGGNARGPVAGIDVGGFMATLALNVGGPLNVVQTFLQADQAERERGDGSDDKKEVERTVINVASGVAHLPFVPNGVAYAVSKLAGAKLTEFVHHENPHWRVFNMQPGVVNTELARRSGREAPDSPDLPAGLAVWLARSPEALRLNGRFVWANWDLDEVLDGIGEIERRGLLTLGLKGWAEEVSVEELVGTAKGLYRKPLEKKSGE